MNHIKTARRWYKIIPISLILLGTILILYRPVINYWIAPNHFKKIYQVNLGTEGIKQNVELLESQSQERITQNFDFSEVENLSVLDVTSSIRTENVIGGIYIPSTGINLPILYGATNENLRVASATLKPDQVMGTGNYAIAAHNSKNPKVLFGSLRKVQMGAEMYLTDKNKVYIYKMVDRKVVMPERIDVIDDVENKKLLTLISCFSWDGSDRLVVTGELTQVVDYIDVDKEVFTAFESL
ncbi:class A sortase [Paenibacillus sp. PK3_47]|uniref:class A sortase n=1 Tax=Paenibacillus sp. PK3_47 TaxID=2072642 RepID=UPI00201DA21B|nr:class A sortase [Paenibacillus sp. PK3_47]